MSEYFWRFHFPVTKVIFKTLKTSGDIWWPTVWRAALQRALLHCEAITPPHGASDAVCCCCFGTRTSFYCLCKDERKNFLHHCLINELASSDPDIIDPCSPLSCNPWNTAGRSRAVKWQVSLHPHSPSNSSLPGHLSSFTRVPSGRLWIPDIVLEFLKEMLDEEYGFWKKKTGQIGKELWWTINGSLINYHFKEILWNIAEQMSPSASRFPLDLKNATRPYPLCHCYVVRGQSWTRINCMGFILILRVPINLNWRLTTEHSL